jgi:hypothetical protein
MSELNPLPIQRHSSLVPYSKDHHFGLLLVWKIKQGLNKSVSPGRISNYVMYFFEKDLEAHFLEEEKNLFPLLPGNDPLRKRGEQEHEHIRGIVRAIEGDKDNPALLLQFADMLKDHIRFEERILFNHLQTLLPVGHLAELGHNGDHKTDIDAAWEDIFWISDQRGL